jgi:subtilisin-like proprotein convertase family protein
MLLWPFSLAATLLSVGPEFQVNSYTPGSQQDPDVAVAPDGSFMIVWRGPGDSPSDVLGRRFASSGAPLGSEFQISAHTLYPLGRPAIAVDPAGRTIVVWGGETITGGLHQVGVLSGRRYDAAGDPLGGKFQTRFLEDGPNPLMVPRVAVDPRGNFVLLTRTFDFAEDYIFGQRYDSSGAALGAPFQVNTYTPGRQSSPDVAALAGGGFVAAWEGSLPDQALPARIVGRRFASTGAALGTEFRIGSDTAAYDLKPELVSFRNGGFAVTWEGRGPGAHVFAQRFGSRGNPLGMHFQVDEAPYEGVAEPDIAADADGNFVVVYRDVNNASREVLLARRFDNTGRAVGGEFVVNSYTLEQPQEPAIASSAAGDFVVTWTTRSEDGDGYGIFARRLRGVSSGRSIASTDVPVSIPDADPAGVTSTLTAPHLIINDVNLVIDLLEHACVTELSIALTSPSGTRAELIEPFGILGFGCTTDLRGTILDDEAAVNLSEGQAPHTGSFNVEHPPAVFLPLSAFDGEDALGTWVLSIADNATRDTGTLEGWSLELTTVFPPPANDSCHLPEIITSNTYRHEVSTFGATTIASDPSPGCGNGSRTASTWYRFTPLDDGMVTATTIGSDYDTILAVFTGSCADLSRVACNDDAFAVPSFGPLPRDPTGLVKQSRVRFAASAGTSYYFMASAWASDVGGQLVFNLELQAPTPTPTPTPSPTPISELLTVNTTDGDGDGTCDTRHCSLQDAVGAANTQEGRNTIVFAIPAGTPGCDGGGVCTIRPRAPLDIRDDATTIDGFTQAGARANTAAVGQPIDAVMKIVLDGSQLFAPLEPVIVIASAQNRVRGLVIHGPCTGIRLDDGAYFNQIDGNFIGTDVSGTRASGSRCSGIRLVDSQGGAGAGGNLIGGEAPENRNLVSGNEQCGILLGSRGANLVQGNYVGTDATGRAALPNAVDGFCAGVLVSYTDAADDRIGGVGAEAANLIAFNGGNGVEVWGAQRTRITRNRIQGNAEAGIVLTEGANAGIAAPQIGSANITRVEGSACPGCTIEIFSAADDEGAIYEGTAVADGAGAWRLDAVTEFVGPNLTATATDADGNTSEFSATAAIRVPCPGDCDGGGTVTLDELVRSVAIALGHESLTACPNLDHVADGQVAVGELVLAVRMGVDGCPHDAAAIASARHDGGGGGR